MSAYTYWPYDEVNLDSPSDSPNLILKTPWLEAITSKELFSADKLSYLSVKLKEQSLSIGDLELVNDFFKHFHKYPVAYILPTPKTSLNLDTHRLLDKQLLDKNIADTLAAIFDNPKGSEILSNSELLKLIKLLPRINWEWDAESALSFATINNTVHPESLLSIARRFHLLELMNNDRGREIFKELEELEPAQFKKAIARLVRQNHYVTQKCQDALKPALALAGQASLLISEFIEEERGHDKILMKTLLHLNEEPENIEVSIQSKALMHLLEFSGQRNFLAFAIAIDAFERSNYEEVDPMAKLLQKGGFNKSAEFINLHMKINDHGDHENIAGKFLQFMNLCDRDYALEALRLAELISLVMTRISLSWK